MAACQGAATAQGTWGSAGLGPALLHAAWPLCPSPWPARPWGSNPRSVPGRGSIARRLRSCLCVADAVSLVLVWPVAPGFSFPSRQGTGGEPQMQPKSHPKFLLCPTSAKLSSPPQPPGFTWAPRAGKWSCFSHHPQTWTWCLLCAKPGLSSREQQSILKEPAFLVNNPRTHSAAAHSRCSMRVGDGSFIQHVFIEHRVSTGDQNPFRFWPCRLLERQSPIR